MFLAGGFSKLATEHSGTALGTRYGSSAAFFVFLYTAVFGATWLTVPWLYPTEIFPLSIRACGNAWGVVGWSIGNGWLTLLSPVMFNAVRGKILYIFCACNFAAIFIVWAFYPETANRTLEEMEFLFAAPTPWVWDAEKTHSKLKAEFDERQAVLLKEHEEKAGA
jgi:hypothetical protein